MPELKAIYLINAAYGAFQKSTVSDRTNTITLIQKRMGKLRGIGEQSPRLKSKREELCSKLPKEWMLPNRKQLRATKAAYNPVINNIANRNLNKISAKTDFFSDIFLRLPLYLEIFPILQHLAREWGPKFGQAREQYRIIDGILSQTL